MLSSLLRIAGGCFAAYLVLLLVMFLFQEKLIFFPTKLSPSHKFSFQQDFTELFVSVDGAKLNVLAFEKPEAQGVILYFHGNAGDLDSWGNVSEQYKDYPYHLLVVDYRGFGKSTGKISSEAQLQADAKAVYEFAVAKYQLKNIVIHGTSIGTGVASWLAAHHPTKALVLETPYVSLTQMVAEIYPFVPSFLLKYKLENDRWLAQCKAPIHLIHGTRDRVVPYTHSEILQKKVPGARLHTIKNGGHNDLSMYPQYTIALKEIFGL